MTDTTENLRRKITSAGDLQSVVRTMKALAASSIGQYERSVDALANYHHALELALGVCFRTNEPVTQSVDRNTPVGSALVGAVVFGSDQGLVGQFNEVVVDYAIEALSSRPGTLQVWAVGERAHARLADAGLPLAGLFAVPTSIQGIAPLIGRILVRCETSLGLDKASELHLFHNHPVSATVYEPVRHRLLPLDDTWRRGLTVLPWPTVNLPEVIGGGTDTLRALIREYLFVSLYRSTAESLASENASRLAAMQRADKNIDELLEELNGDFRRVRQNGIDEELFDVVAGFEALTGTR